MWLLFFTSKHRYKKVNVEQVNLSIVPNVCRRKGEPDISPIVHQSLPHLAYTGCAYLHQSNFCRVYFSIARELVLSFLYIRWLTVLCSPSLFIFERAFTKQQLCLKRILRLWSISRCSTTSIVCCIFMTGGLAQRAFGSPARAPSRKPFGTLRDVGRGNPHWSS